MSTLYIVGTPIGNLEDITFRALRILKEVSVIAAEDTRNTKHLLTHFDIHTPLISFHEYSDENRIQAIIEKLQVGDVALVTDAGMPCVSDPGYELIKAAYENNIKVNVIPGPSASVSAIALSGMPSEHFTFIGFLPRKESDKTKLLKSISRYPHSLIFYEAPHRLNKTLCDILSTLGDREIAVTRELTKIHEEVFKGTISSAIEYFEEPKGEFTFVVAGFAGDDVDTSSLDVDTLVKMALESGKSFKDALPDLASSTGLNRRELYSKWLDLEKGVN